MTLKETFKALAAPFDARDLKAYPLTISKKTGKGLAAYYVDNRAIMDRLDSVLGPENWRNEFAPGPGGGVICGISIRIGNDWVTKWDGAENSDIEPVKGGLSSAMRRAAVQWGIGRYLYEVEGRWIPVNERGVFAEDPIKHFPKEFLPVDPNQAIKDRIAAARAGKPAAKVRAIYKKYGMDKGDLPPDLDVDAIIQELEAL